MLSKKPVCPFHPGLSDVSLTLQGSTYAPEKPACALPRFSDVFPKPPLKWGSNVPLIDDGPFNHEMIFFYTFHGKCAGHVHTANGLFMVMIA